MFALEGDKVCLTTEEALKEERQRWAWTDVANQPRK